MKLKPVVIIDRNSLSFLSPEMAKKASMTIEESVFDDMEIKDPKSFDEQLKNFLVAKKLTIKETTLVISKNLLFYKNLEKNEDFSKSKEEFLSDIPLKPEDISTLEIDSEANKTIISSRKKLYKDLIKALKKQNIEIEAVIPENVDNKKYSAQDLLKIANTKEITKNLNFLLITPVEKRQVEKKKERKFVKHETPKKEEKVKKQVKSSITPLKILVPVFIIVVLLAGYLAYLKFGIKKEIPEEIVEETIVQEKFIEEEPEITYLKKEDIKIQILNGTGTPGLAGTTASELETLGFSNISVGNAEEEQETTTITYSENISEDTLEEILIYLEDTFEETLEDSMEEDNSEIFSIIVTTGKLLTD